MDEKYQNNKKKPKATKKEHEKSIKGQKDIKSAPNDIFNFDNEIVIGVTKIPEKKKKQNKNRTEHVGAGIASPQKERKNKREKIKQDKSKKEDANKNRKREDKLRRKLEKEKTLKTDNVVGAISRPKDEDRQNSKKSTKEYETIQVEVKRKKVGQDELYNENESKKNAKKKKSRNSKIEEQYQFENSINFKEQNQFTNNINSRKQNQFANNIISKKQNKFANSINFKKQNEPEEGLKKEIKNKIVKAVAKWTFLTIALIVAIIIFMMSPLFDLSNIQVVNNEKLSSETIISLSKIQIGENIYKNSKKQIQKNIKENAYIESVKIDRKIPNKIVLTVKERKATFLLEYANSYAYINNQGYILEISEQKQDLPILVGYVTNTEDIKEGNRLQEEDLEKLETVLKIMESASGNGINELITKINVQNKQNYTLELESEKKIVYLGDVSNLSNRMLYLKAVLEEEKGIEGEIFINGDLHKEAVYFRKKE